VTAQRPTALIAEDEPLLREALERQLLQCWPQVTVVALARNGREAVDLFEEHQPDVCFLDVHMPGMTGIEVAHHIGRRAHLVFVTAFDQYAVQAFAHGVLDYLVKPVDAERMAQTVVRLQERLRDAQPVLHTEASAAAVGRPFRAPIGDGAVAVASGVGGADRQHDSGVQRRLIFAPRRSTRSSPGGVPPASRARPSFEHP
jgi:DNA-binding LytR/AlgR family response regulator